MKKVAILIDGGFFARKYKEIVSNYPKAVNVIKFVKKCIGKNEELFRIYYYNCPAYSRKTKLPVSLGDAGFDTSTVAGAIDTFHNQLSKSDFVALRKGIINFVGWSIKPNVQNEIKSTPRALTDNDYKPVFRQKQIDMKIGLDVAWLSTKHIVDKIILVAGDSDFIPALKFARREGIQTVLVTLNHTIRGEMKEHCDEFRIIKI